jgi:hypothetical protein
MCATYRNYVGFSVTPRTYCHNSALSKFDVGRIGRVPGTCLTPSVLCNLLTLPPPSQPRPSAGPPVGGLSSGVVGNLAATLPGSWYDLPHASPKEGSAAWPARFCTEGSDAGTDGTNP